MFNERRFGPLTHSERTEAQKKRVSDIQFQMEGGETQWRAKYEDDSVSGWESTGHGALSGKAQEEIRKQKLADFEKEQRL